MFGVLVSRAEGRELHFGAKSAARPRLPSRVSTGIRSAESQQRRPGRVVLVRRLGAGQLSRHPRFGRAQNLFWPPVMSGRLRKMSQPALDAGPFIDKVKWDRQMTLRADFDIPSATSQFWLSLSTATACVRLCLSEKNIYYYYIIRAAHWAAAELLTGPNRFLFSAQGKEALVKARSEASQMARKWSIPSELRGAVSCMLAVCSSAVRAGVVSRDGRRRAAPPAARPLPQGAGQALWCAPPHIAVQFT